MANNRARAATDSPTVEFNLDAFEAEAKANSKPFTAIVKGKRYELIDANDIDYRDLLQADAVLRGGDPTEFFQKIVPEKQREEFFANRLTGRALQQLFTLYNAHFGLGGEPGEGSGSPT